MRFISENTPPTELIAWKAKQTAAGLEPHYKDFDAAVRNPCLEQRLKDQGHLCAYTMRRIDAERAHLEHIKAQSQHSPADTVDYGNMVACFPAGHAANPGYGALERGAQPLSIHPRMLACQTRLRFKVDGTVEGADTDAQRTIQDVLKLNDARLVAMRKEAIEAAGLGLTQDAVGGARAREIRDHAMARSPNGKLPEYCVALAQLAQDHIGRLEKAAKQGKRRHAHQKQ